MKTRPPLPARLALWAALPMAETSNVGKRLTRILDPARSRRQITRRGVAATLALVTLAVVPLAALQPTTRAQTAGEAPAGSDDQNERLRLEWARHEAARLQQAQELRDHLSGWAQAHKTSLTLMQQAHPDDLAALMRVYDSLDRLPLPLWPGDPRAGHGDHDGSFGLETPFGLTLRHLQRSQEPVDQAIRGNFAKFRDFQVARSIDPGMTSIVLWASGRITRSTLSFHFAGRRKPLLMVERQEDLVPSFFR